MRSIRFILILLFLQISINTYSQLNHKHYLLMGRIDLSEEEYSEAILNFNLAITAKPADFEAYFLRGIAKYSLNDFNGAVDDFSKAISIHPLYTRAYHYRGISNDRLGNYADAISDYKKAIELDPYDPDLHIALGSTRLHLNEFESAILCFDTALIIKPDNSYAYINRGVAKRYLELYDEALDDLNKAVYYDFFNIEAIVRRGILYMEQNKYQEAMADLTNALDMDGDNPIIYFNRGTVLLNMGDTISALKDYERVNNLDERNALTYFNRAIIYSMLKENDIALALYNKVIEINPGNIYGYYNRGILYYKMKEFDNAERDFTKVIELFPDFIDAWVNRSVVRYEKGDIEGAENDRLKSIDIMNFVSESENNVDSLYRIYSESIDYDNILAFESDFSSGDRGGKLAQFSSVDIRPFNNFIVGVIEFDKKKVSERKNSYFSDATMSHLNDYEKLDGIRLAYLEEDFLNENYQSLLNDSIVDNIAQDELNIFLNGLLNYEIHNYQHAENNFKSLLEDETYGLYAAINLGTLYQNKAELVLSDQNYNDPVTITQKKYAEERSVKIQVKPDYQQALEVFTSLVEKYKTNPFVWYNLGNVHLMMQEFHKAVDDYTLAIRYENNMAEAYYNRGLTLLFLGEKDLAGKDLSKAGELGIKEAYAVMKRFLGN